ncbi:MAG: hypothetical protein HY787_04335 [Deltaproteobacteria bacterium]|nr:hypothetical protein [Deltaproteobacteria bacterium]
MTKKEYVERNIGVTFDFVRHMIDHPELVDTIPDGAELDFIDKNIPFKEKDQKRKRIARYKVQHSFEPIKA